MNQRDYGDERLGRPGVADEINRDLANPAVEGEAVALDLAVQEQLGKIFRAYCDDLIHQPIPDKFVVLLAKLEAKQRAKK